MAVVAALVLLAGVCMVAVTGIFALISVGNLRWARKLRRAVPTPIGSWRGGVVSTEAVTEHGTAGPQVGPLSRADCAWYEMTIVRMNNSDNRSDVRIDAGRSPAWPVLADPSGRVTIDPGLLTDRRGESRTEHAPSACLATTEEWERRRDGAPPPFWVTPAIERSCAYGDQLTLLEVRLPRGRRVFAIGRASGGSLRRGLVTPGRWADLITAREDDLRLMTRAIPAFAVLGLAVAAGGYGLLLLVTR
ncbi:hypothetical protein GCM10010172_48360 [Paractinoplanes ferrugineus]|uniref:Uncharacterized protein n=1 Tax=Paractinoplanes ferrugineus TaxID=113564 RepID=A0A919J086_9ACTN|nr:hypothetical protein [Actinoplanes ferrugineus]GIE11097.1 hypothetical protein Afe05nite_29370 [Actinoplanes ferrugineus]